MAKREKRKLSAEEIFVEVAQFGAIVDKDGVEAAIKFLDKIHKRAAVPTAARRKHSKLLFDEFHTGDVQKQKSIANRLANLTNALDSDQ